MCSSSRYMAPLGISPRRPKMWLQDEGWGGGEGEGKGERAVGGRKGEKKHGGRKIKPVERIKISYSRN